QMLLLNEELRANLKTLKYLLVGGEPLPINILKETQQITSSKIYNLYGPTETTIWSSVKDVTNDNNVNIGKPISNTQIYILDSNSNLQPTGVSGELCIAGDGLSRGYLNNVSMTNEKFIVNPFGEKKLYKTGDLARWLTDGNIEILGRIDDQVKIRGFRVELGEIENHLLELEEIKEAVVIARDDSGEKYLCAYIVTESDVDTKEMRSKLSKSLPEYMIPSYFVKLNSIPLTSNGKVDKKALLSPELEAGEDYVAPRNELEEKLIEICSEVLKVDKEKISVNANFFEIGGNSIRVMSLVSLIHKNLDVNIEISEVFASSTINDLAEIIEKKDVSKFTSIERTVEKPYYGLSSAQERMYLLQQMSINSTAYNMPNYFPTGDVSKERIQNVVDILLERHESFRTSFVLLEDIPKQQILPLVELRVEEHEVHNLKELEKLHDDFIKPFDISLAPLLRVAYVKDVNSKVTYLMTDMHHIISDGESVAILQEEFKRLLNGEELESLNLQYKDYSEWQNSKEHINEVKHQEEYWKNEYIDEIPVLNLPYDYSRPTEQSYDGASISFKLEEDLSNKIKFICKDANTTSYMVFLSIFTVLLSKLSGQEDIVIGSPITGREHSDLFNIIGVFVNTLAIRNYPNGELTYKEFLKNVKNRVSKAFDNQLYQFEDLVDNVKVKRDIGRNPIFDVSLDLQTINEEFSDSILSDKIEHKKETAKFDLSLDIIESKNSFYLIFNYCTKLFKLETINKFVVYFKNIIDRVAGETMLGDLDILTEEERNQILYDFNDTRTDYPKEKTIHQMFEEQVEKTPEKVAIVLENREITYGELNSKSNQLARSFRSKGVKPDTVIGMMVDRSFEMIIGILGILKSGVAYLPIEPEYPEERINYMLNDAEVEILLTQSNYVADLSNKYDQEIINLDNTNVYTGDDSNLNMISNSNNLAYVIYTSGSTGKPKGVMVEHRNVVAYITSFYDFIKILPSDIMLQQASYTFDTFIEELYTVLFKGGTLAIPPKNSVYDISTLVEFINDNNISIVDCSPLLLNELNKEAEKLSNVRILLSGGDVLKNEYISNFKNIDIYNGYGPTETTVCASFFECNQNDQPFMPIGKPISN
ncbi:MAG: AMP-binding protein, partial [Candidatus Delongbacteria bacterium]|nr:AMP-binding protein [Candidatus Delongbacteria bacterium]